MKSEKNVTVHDLASRLYVCEATIRRDLTAMQRMGVVRRSHGGALIAEAADEISMFVRMNVNAKEKEAVAANALPHIPDFKSLFIDSSSTALALAQRLDLAGKTVVTNNLQTALSLSRMEDINLIILGGNITLSSVSITGSWTARQLQSFSFDLMLASCASIRKRTAFEKTLDQREIKTGRLRKFRRASLARGQHQNKRARGHLHFRQSVRIRPDRVRQNPARTRRGLRGVARDCRLI